MKKIILGLVVCLSVFLSVSTMASEQERRMEYSLTALNNVTTMWHWMGDVDGNWSTNVTRPFVGGVADSELDLSWGPGLYRSWVNWSDTNGGCLFSSYGSLKRIEAGVNYMDFPMYVSYWRGVCIKLPLDANEGEVWVNGCRAWFDGYYWHVSVSTPWNVTKLTVVWSGHGQWLLSTNPTFNYGQVIAFKLKDMDTSVTSPAQAFGISYLGEISWPAEQVVFVRRVEYDQTLEASVLVCENTIFAGYGKFQVMVSMQYYDQNLGEFVQYFNQYVDVSDGEFMVPLINNNGGNMLLPVGTVVKFVYGDPADGGVVKQQWDYTIYSPQGGEKG